VLASFNVLAAEASDVRRDIDTNFFGLLHLARAFTPVLGVGRKPRSRAS
jgi:hypothetical protein